MAKEYQRFPETAVFGTKASDYLFEREVNDVLAAIDRIIQNFGDNHTVYVNNTIGIIGGRGSGKSSVLQTVNEILSSTSKSVHVMKTILDPKVLPNHVSIINYVLSVLYSDFSQLLIQPSNDFKTDINAVLQSFEELNASIAFLSKLSRAETIDNPSDLYDVAQVTNIRRSFASLIEKLLSVYFPKKEKTNAFLVCIDDFDLDSGNLVSMISDIVSFLTIPGLVFLFAFDDDILSFEILRQRMDVISNFGKASNSLFESRPSTVSYAMPKYGLRDLILRSEKYETQLYNKFLPQDYRVKIGMPSINEPAFLALANDLCEWLFGFNLNTKPSPNHPYEDEVVGIIRNLCQRFVNAIGRTSDLRTRNQLLNQIISSFEKEKETNGQPLDPDTIRLSSSIKEMSKIAESTDNQELLRVVGERIIAYADFEKKADDLAAHSREIVYSDIFHNLSFSQLAETYFKNHPCAQTVYESVMSELDLDESSYAEKLICFLSLVRGEDLHLAVKEGGERFLAVDNMELNLGFFVHPTMTYNRKSIAKSINEYVGSKKVLAKYQVQKFRDLLVEYNESLITSDRSLTRFIRSLNALLEKRWAGTELRSARDESRRVLYYAAKHLQQ